MNFRNRDNLKAALVLATVFALAMWAAGCKTGTGNININATDSSLAAADAYIVSATPHTSKVGKPLLEKARGKIGDAGRSNAAAAVDYGKLETKYTKLDGKWYVWIGRWIERLLGLIAGIWLASGIFGVVAGGGLLGAGKLFGIGRFILGVHHALPLPNPWSPAANYLLKSKEIAV